MSLVFSEEKRRLLARIIADWLNEGFVSASSPEYHQALELREEVFEWKPSESASND